jgi:uncharacterized protein YndB with AHSA1/START domain
LPIFTLYRQPNSCVIDEEAPMSVPDEIRRQVSVRADRERVWRALTEPAELLRWFPTTACEFDPTPGTHARFEWDEGGDEAIVEQVEPGTRLVYRWRPLGSDRPYTTVTFELADDGDGTLLTLTELGFASLPDQTREQSWEGNDEGWRKELEELRADLEAA